MLKIKTTVIDPNYIKALLILFILLVSLVAALYLAKQRQEIRKEASTPGHEYRLEQLPGQDVCIQPSGDIILHSLLIDAQTEEIVTDQSAPPGPFVYEFRFGPDFEESFRFEIMRICERGIKPPCPEDHHKISAQAVGSSTLEVRVYYPEGGTDVPPLAAAPVIYNLRSDPSCLTPSPSPTPAKGYLSFIVKFQGASPQKPYNKTVKVLLRQDGQEKQRFENVRVALDHTGAGGGGIVDIEPGIYDILIKGWVHLQKVFRGKTINSGENLQSFADIELLAGDADGNNLVNALDVALLVEHYRPHTPIDSPADFNLDGIVNALDVRYVVENYNKSGEIE